MDSRIICVVLYAFLAVCCARSTLGQKLPNGGKIWAFLVAGSNDFSNYRHQADVCHAYQILHANGIPDENIIVMMYDDIAYSQDNPTPGVIINEPNGTNLYEGVLKDYTGSEVNPANFLKVLTGDSNGMAGIGSGRVIKSGPNDHVFVNFVDHGAVGLLAFPAEELYALDLEKSLKQMANNQQFAKLVLYIEACESGSMFDAILPDNMNIFAVTAADPRESSYACFYDAERQTYLGDVFSVNWMADAEKAVLLRETLHHQFEVVRTETNTSHVEEYGDLDLGSMHVADFIGFKMAERNGKLGTTGERKELNIDDAVPNPHVPVAVLHRKLELTDDPKERDKINFQLRILLKKRAHLERVTLAILQRAADGNTTILEALQHSRHPLTRANFPCYQNLASHFSEACFKFSENPHALRQLYMLVNVCQEAVVPEEVVLAAMDRICSKKTTISGIV